MAAEWGKADDVSTLDKRKRITTATALRPQSRLLCEVVASVNEILLLQGVGTIGRPDGVNALHDVVNGYMAYAAQGHVRVAAADAQSFS